MLQNAVDAFLDGNTTLSEHHLASLFADRPHFAPANILHAELLAARAHQNSLLSLPKAVDKPRISGVGQETVARITYRPPPAGYFPENVLRLSNKHDYVLLLDAAQSRIYVLQNKDNKPVRIADYYAAIAKGGMGKTREDDKKTPIGLYRINGHLEDQTLPELYGHAAYTLDYPNDWDQISNRGGYGIWLHGTPREIYSRPPRDSRGCIVLSNHLIKSLARYVKPGLTPIILAPSTTWLPPEQWEIKSQAANATIQQWEDDWESMDIERYLAHYSEHYRTQADDYQNKVRNARQHAKKKKYVEVDTRNLDLFLYSNAPAGGNQTLVAVFDQDYRSNTHNDHYRKRQFWEKGDSGWKIVYAGKEN